MPCPKPQGLKRQACYPLPGSHLLEKIEPIKKHNAGSSWVAMAQKGISCQKRRKNLNSGMEMSSGTVHEGTNGTSRHNDPVLSVSSFLRGRGVQVSSFLLSLSFRSAACFVEEDKPTEERRDSWSREQSISASCMHQPGNDPPVPSQRAEK